jgi:hypothetical protein
LAHDKPRFYLKVYRENLNKPWRLGILQKSVSFIMSSWAKRRICFWSTENRSFTLFRMTNWEICKSLDCKRKAAPISRNGLRRHFRWIEYYVDVHLQILKSWPYRFSPGFFHSGCFQF